MPRPIRFLALVAALLATAGCFTASETGTRRGALSFAECRLKDVATSAWCAELQVPEDRAKPEGRRIAIHVALMPAYVRNRASDPLFILAGGPGQAASDIGKIGLVFDTVRRTRDIVLVDQRGTGRSHAFTCKLFDALDPVVAMMQMAPDASRLRQCLDAFDGDPRQYTTPAFVEDLEAVRAALGSERVNLWGGSYGSRVALAYIKAHPGRIRSAIIDGVAPTSMRIIQEGLLNGEDALERTLADCAASASCAAAYPHLADDWAMLAREFGIGQKVTFAHPRTGVPQTVDVDFLALDGAMRTLLYSADYATMVPELMTRAASGDFAPLFAASLRIVGDLGQGMNVGLLLSVVCAEDAARVDPPLRAAASRRPVAANVFARVDEVCRAWPHGTVDAAFHEPTSASTPVLALSGGIDPVTPRANADLAVKTLPNATHIVAPGYAHLVSPFACAPRLVARFVEDASAAALPQDCVAALESSKRPAFFVNALEARP